MDMDIKTEAHQRFMSKPNSNPNVTFKPFFFSKILFDSSSFFFGKNWIYLSIIQIVKLK